MAIQIFWFLLLSNAFIFVYPFNHTVHHFKINIFTCYLLGYVSAPETCTASFHWGVEVFSLTKTFYIVAL